MNKQIILLAGLILSIGCYAAEIDNGAEIDAMAQGTVLGLHFAIDRGDFPRVKELVKIYGIEGRDGFGATCLMVAAQGSREAMVDYFLKNGADVTAQTEGKWTALHNAAGWNASQKVVEMLLTAGADKEVKNGMGQTPEVVARVRNHPELADYIASFAVVKSAGKR